MFSKEQPSCVFVLHMNYFCLPLHLSFPLFNPFPWCPSLAHSLGLPWLNISSAGFLYLSSSFLLLAATRSCPDFHLLPHPWHFLQGQVDIIQVK